MAIRNNLDDIVNVDIEISTPGSSDESFNNVLLVVEGPVVGKKSTDNRRISELGGYENVDDSAKVDVFGFDIADVSGSIRLFSDVMKRLEIKLDGDGLYEEFQRVYDESVIRNADKHREEPIEKNRVLKGR